MSTVTIDLEQLYRRRTQLQAEADVIRARLLECENLIRMVGGEQPAFQLVQPAPPAPAPAPPLPPSTPATTAVARHMDLTRDVKRVLEKSKRPMTSGQVAEAGWIFFHIRFQPGSVPSALSRMLRRGEVVKNKDFFSLPLPADAQPSEQNGD